MRNMSMSRKLWATLALMWLGMLIMVGWMAYEKKQTLIQERMVGLERVITSATNLVNSYVERVKNGELGEEEAKRLAIENVAPLTFNGSYIYIFNDDIRLVWHPKREAGKDMSGFKDDNGIYFYRELREVAQPPEGGTFLYTSYNEKAGRDESRLNYVQRVPEWDWYLATNVYITDIDDTFWSSMFRMGLVILCIGLILTGIMAWIIRGVLGSLGGDPQQARHIVQRIASGDLSHPLQLTKGDNSSLLFAIESMRTRLVQAMQNVHRASNSIGVGITQINSGNQDLSARTEQQSASIEETAASMEELTHTVRQNSDNAHQASRLANDTSVTARQGGDMMERVVGTMQDITESSRKATDIIELIDSIAFQTNILALNASVEAARAGEQGRGFAVVANEVRTLASRSASASQDIRSLLEASHQKISQGSNVVNEAGDTIQKVIDSVAKMTALMQEISTASSEQTSGIEQVNLAIGQMDQVTQQNANLVQEAAGAAEALREQVSALENEVSWFKLSGHSLESSTANSFSQDEEEPRSTQLSLTNSPRNSRSLTTTNEEEEWITM